MRGNYEWKLLQEVNYHHAKNVGIVGILVYPKRLELKSTSIGH